MNKSLNMIKCIGAFCVIIIHCVSLSDNQYLQFLDAIVRFATPIFALISGYYGYFHDENIDIEQKYKKRAWKIFGLIIISTIIYFIYKLYSFNGDVSKVFRLYNWNAIYKLIFLNISVLSQHLWYLWAILYCYILLIIMKKLNFKINSLYRYIPILLVLNILIGEVLFVANIKIQNIYTRNFLLMILPFFMIGYYINETQIYKKINTNYLVFICILSTILTVIERINTAVLNTYVGTIFLSISIFMLCLKYPMGARLHLIEWIGTKLSTSIYIIHFLILKIIEQIEEYNNYKGNKILVINIFITFIVSVLISTIIYFIKNLINIARTKWKQSHL